MSLRRFVLVTHRWVGLATSAVLAVVGVTGAVMVWGGQGVLHRLAGRFHETLALGRPGAWVVAAATAGALALQFGGLFLWWRRKSLAVRTRAGWKPALTDLHHAAGLLGWLIMFLLTVTALAMVATSPQTEPEFRRLIVQIHSAARFPIAAKFVYALGSTLFLIQGLTGVVMWWKPAKRA